MAETYSSHEKLVNFIEEYNNLLDTPEKVLLYFIGMQCGHIMRIESGKKPYRSSFAMEFLPENVELINGNWKNIYSKSSKRLTELRGINYRSALKDVTGSYYIKSRGSILSLSEKEARIFLFSGLEKILLRHLPETGDDI